MEKIRSGQPFLYRNGGLNSTVLDMRMKNNIRGDFLQRALTTTLQRYPYMTSKLVEKNGDFYIEEDPFSMTVIKTKKFRCLGSINTGYHLVDVTYAANRIYIAFHHALCDGRGVKPFAETLIYYYCCLRFNKKPDRTGIRLADDPLLPGETQEPVGYTKYEVNENNLPQVEKAGYTLPENAEAITNYYRHEININNEQFVKYAKDHNATPSILLALLVSRGIKKIHSEASKPVVCSLAVDCRKEIGLDNTHKNCVGSIYLPYSEKTEKLSLPEQSTLYRSIIKDQKNPDAVKSLINSQIDLFGKLDQLPSLEAKKQMLSFFNDLCIDTYVISYLGQMQLGGCSEYVESIHLYNSGVKGLRINMISAGDCIAVDVLQSFESEEIVKVLTESLDKAGIAYTASGKIVFETPKDKAQITAGRQAERYYKSH